MIIKGNEDLRIQKTITAIKDAFSDMLLTMDYDKITVKELCDRAKINKKTFYKYYENLDFLLEEILTTLSKGFLDKIKNYSVPEDLEKVNRDFFLYSVEQGLLYERIVCYAAHRDIGSKLIGDIVNRTWSISPAFNNLNPQHKNIFLCFVYNVGIELYRQWVNDGKKLPVDEIINLTYCAS